ncbi:MAG: ABC transporter ATP-binding protein [Treponema sp.]|jgi:branched-chain amino acid transport system ATP-binding protein|nr:ABC transporter ATP-binding protein [Treponema sp.]
MLEISGLSVNYDHVAALDDISCVIKDGDIVSIIGSNGAGKTTLLNAISAVVKKRSGSISMNGTPLSQKPHRVVRTGIIHVPEGRHVFANLTVTENLIMGGSRLPLSKSYEKMAEMYKFFPILEERRSQMAGTLSGGEQQMLAIVRGLMGEPKILLLDEPSLGLAPRIVKQVFELIKKINGMGITILLVEQNASQAVGISGYTYVLENGRIVYEGKPGELWNNEKIKKAYLGG